MKEHTILYVDDDNANRVVMKHNLGQEFTLVTADSGPAALEIMAQRPIAVLLTDQRMPQMSGVDLAARTLELHPEIVRVIITAYSDLEATIDAINRAHVNRFIKKPWTREELTAVMRESVTAYHNARLVAELQQRLSRIDRATTIAVMAAAIAHDLCQPLQGLTIDSQTLTSDAATLQSMKETIVRAAAAPGLGAVITRVHDLSGDILAGVQQLNEITQAILSSLKGREATRARMDLRRVVEMAVTILRSTVRDRGRFEVELPVAEVAVIASEGQLLQVLLNLLLNAAQALDPTTKLRNHVRLQLRATDDALTLSIEDNGCGIPEDKLEQVFAPFYTTKGADGTGLGLAICRQIVQQMGGTIAVESAPGRGSRFVVTLPPGTAP